MNKLALIRKAMKASRRVRKGKSLSSLDSGSPNLIRPLNNVRGKSRPHPAALDRWFKTEVKGKFSSLNTPAIAKAGKMRKDLHRRMRKAK